MSWIRMFRTQHDVSATVLRLALGIMILPHGLQKVFGWFGGGGFAGTIQYFDQAFGIPALIVVLVMAAEFLGGLGLLTGFLTRASAAGVAAVMVGAVFIGGHLSNGFFMNWSGQQAGEGFEFHLLALGIAIALMIKGGGAFSIDRGLAQELLRTEAVEQEEEEDVPVGVR